VDRPQQLVDKPEQLAACVDDVSRSSRVGLDTESNGFHAYFEKVCLLQIATPDAESFRRSESYITGQIARAVARGQRSL